MIFILLFLSIFLFCSDIEYLESVHLDSFEKDDLIYKVGANDILKIEVFDNPNLTGTFNVLSDGTITFPLLGDVQISGLNIIEIKKLITNKLEVDYLYDPIVSITVKEYKSKSVTIIGNIKKPGIYYLEKPTQILDVLLQSDIISLNSGKIKSGQKAHIIRNNYKQSNTDSLEASSSKSMFIDLYELLVKGKESLNIFLQNGDVIYIPEIQSVHVIGEVIKPGSFPFEEGMTVLKIITLAGGSTKKASQSTIFIRRIKKGKEEKIKAKTTDLVEPDDIVEVPLSFW